ncbi:uncharacterized protein LOC127873579 [Dreissena polymorpha]|uniref:Ion transport domain-containing protein n=1 Tax=Dreissena polymorpha TaxID=45954 RepID=A0A9D4KRK1_DREPO|nr:uncharacterized protein LOC127873579 [Dreissena polymorpha]KAH3844389.1 hypothetical protein DPMN_086647 [Dreissena polymorpha]
MQSAIECEMGAVDEKSATDKGASSNQLVDEIDNADCNTENNPTVVVDIDRESHVCHDEDDKTVTLRDKKTDTITRISDDDYRYMRYLDNTENISKRRKDLIGSEKLISDADLRLAATLVHDAMEGRTADIKSEIRYVKSYNLYKSWPLTYLLYIAIIVNLSLVLFEEPAVEGLALKDTITMPIELLCILYFCVRTAHHYFWRRTSLFFRDVKNTILIMIIVVTLIDMVVYLIWKHVDPEANHVRFSRVLRAIVIVNFSDGRQIRRSWRNMRRTIKEIIHVVFLFSFFILVFSLIANQMFSARSDIKYLNGKAYFKDYLECVWEMYVLVTTSNNPDVMIPALKASRYYCIFFFVYIVVVFYMLLNVFLAVAYHSYSENMKLEIQQGSRDKKKKLGQAFDVIKVNHEGEDMVTYRTWKRLMNLVQPNLSNNQIDLLMLILNTKRSGHIGRREFMNVADLLNVQISEVSDRITWLEKTFPRLYLSVPSEFIRTIVDTVFFKFAYDLLVGIEIFLIGFNVPGINIPFCALYILEVVLKVYTFGPIKYFHRVSNWFDVIITSVSLIFLIVESTVLQKDDDQTRIIRETISAVNIIRIFRILRLLVHINRFKIIIDTLINISMSILMYCGILFIIFYVFAVIGMEIFKGKIRSFPVSIGNDTSEKYCGALALNNSEFYKSEYCYLNFNDVIGSALVLATVTFQNNWHQVTSGYVLVTNRAARIYFATFFMFVSIIVMNIVTAFIVDMFMYEYTIQKDGKVDSSVEKKIKELGLGIDAETGLEISQPLSDEQMKEWMRGHDVKAPLVHPWIEKATLRGIRHAEARFSTFSSYVHKRKSSVPTLNRFDGIRFHIKKKGWTKIEVLLQQLYDIESDLDNIKTDEEDRRSKALIL